MISIYHKLTKIYPQYNEQSIARGITCLVEDEIECLYSLIKNTPLYYCYFNDSLIVGPKNLYFEYF